MIRLATIALLAGCFHPTYDRPACGPGGECPDALVCVSGTCEAPGELPGDPADAMADAVADAGPGADAFCAGTSPRICVDQLPANLIIAIGTLDTTTTQAGICMAYTATPDVPACVIAARSITLQAGQKLTVVGAKALVLLGETITISGTLDAASHRGGSIGPAADPSDCTATPPNTGGGRADGGGGAGGSFGTAGGNGGNGGEDGTGGVAGPARSPTAMRGGCKGSDGAGGGGAGGHGGGAVGLLASRTLRIDGIVNASGASGAAGTASGGGGGGGAGGLILLEAPSVTVTGACFANGGGGGEGANIATDGLPGGESTAPSTPGAGGTGGTAFGGDGGAGATDANGARPGSVGDARSAGAIGGGGGGGGGVGAIHLDAATHMGTDDPTKVSPHTT